MERGHGSAGEWGSRLRADPACGPRRSFLMNGVHPALAFLQDKMPTARAVGADRRDDCRGLPDCLDLRMRPPIPSPSIELAGAPSTGPCARCGRARVCPSAREIVVGEQALKPLRHADAASAELAALRVLSAAAALPLADALEAYEVL